MGKRGRRKGYEMSQKSKNKIARSASGKEKGTATRDKTAKAVHKYNLCIKRNVVRGVLLELRGCRFIAEVHKCGAKTQLLYVYHDRIQRVYVHIHKRVTTLEVEPVRGCGDHVIKKIKRMKMRKGPGIGWNIGTKLYVTIREDQNVQKS